MGDEDVMVSKLYDVFWEERREKKERLSCEDGDRDESDAATSHRMPGTLAFLEGLCFLSLFFNLGKKKGKIGKNCSTFPLRR